MSYLNAESTAKDRASYFEEFARLVCRGSSPLYERLARGVAGDEELLELAAHIRPDQPPNLFFSAVHFLLLKGARHPLADFYESVGGAASAEDADPLPAFRDFCRERREELIGLISTRIVQTNEIGRYACIVPAFGLVSRMAGGRPLATVEVGASAGLGLLWDKYGYDYGEGGRCGDAASPVQNFCESRGPLLPPVPRTLPPVASRVGLDLNPIDVRDREATLWLHALVFPEHRGRAERLSRALELAKRDPPHVLAGDAAEMLAASLHEIPEGTPVCLFNSFTLTQFPDEARGRLLRTLAEFASRRELYHVSLEWFGGEHPLLELHLYDGAARAEKLTLASCDAHGGWLRWLDRSRAAPRAGPREHLRASARRPSPFSAPFKSRFHSEAKAMSKKGNKTNATKKREAGKARSSRPTDAGGRAAAPLHTIARHARAQKEARHVEEKRKQPGIGFPSAGAQSNLLIVRLSLSSSDVPTVREGLRRLCGLFERIDTGEKRIDVLDGGTLERVPLKAFHFSATVGFGMGFFQMLNIPAGKRPAKLKLMPDNTVLLDPAPYVLGQTDLIIQLGSSQDFINRWVLENALEPHELARDETASPPADDVPDDIVTAIRGWAVVSEVHAGFQRVDGRNLLGFNDGVSNPRRLSPLFDQTVWTTSADEGDRPDFVDGTYMVFQKIAHDLDQWRALDRPTQEAWIGRSKGTGLLLGTLPPEEDSALALALRSNDPAVRDPAVEKWESLFKPQTDPTTPFYDHVGGDQHPYEGKPVYGDIPNQCPMWSHVRKANQRQEDGQYTAHYVFRRGYPYMENGPDNTISTGLLFVCFQHDLEESFEFVKTIWLNSSGFPVPLHDGQFVVDGHQVVPRVFTQEELRFRHSRGRFTADELKALTPDQRQLLGYADDKAYRAAIEQAAGDPRTQETGREGLSGPSINGVNVDGEQVSTVALGGGYYFVPPIPDQNMAEIGQQFFS